MIRRSSGTGPKVPTPMSSKPVLLHFKFEDFANLPSEVDSEVPSDEQTDCNGNKWKLQLYPGGTVDAEEEGYVGLYLNSCNTKTIEAKQNFSIIGNRGSVCGEEESDDFDVFGEENKSWGWTQFKRRSDILDPANEILKDGALCIDVIIQVKPKKGDMYQPLSPHSANMLKLLKSTEDADVSFTVGTQTFLAHNNIIKASSPILANFSNRIASPVEDSDTSTAKSIDDISPEVFQMILKHIYSGCYPAIKDAIKCGKELINGANKFELVELKMAVENILVRERVIKEENVSEYIIFADSMCCPLLKEYAISYFLLRYKDVLKSEESAILCESRELLSEIFTVMGSSSSDVGVESLDVAQLRKELCRLKLDVDGSKEALVSRLEEAKRQKTD
jgi:speckle-type POZ protein